MLDRSMLPSLTWLRAALVGLLVLVMALAGSAGSSWG
jgi:hypothetical protein